MIVLYLLQAQGVSFVEPKQQASKTDVFRSSSAHDKHSVTFSCLLSTSAQLAVMPLSVCSLNQSSTFSQVVTL